MRIAGRCFIVTGAASGLGHATTDGLVRRGARVVAFDRDGDGLTHSWNGHPDVTIAVGDLCDEADLVQCVEIAERTGALGGLVNSAGVGERPSRLVDRDGRSRGLESWRAVLEVNLVGAFNLTRLVAEALARRQDKAQEVQGVVVHVSSIAAIDGNAGISAYAASKGALLPLVQTLARDLSPWGIRVFAIAPGVFDTGMFQALPPGVRQACAKDYVLPARPGRPEEFADLVAHVVENDYLNGDCIRIDAGMRMHR